MDVQLTKPQYKEQACKVVLFFKLKRNLKKRKKYSPRLKKKKAGTKSPSERRPLTHFR